MTSYIFKCMSRIVTHNTCDQSKNNQYTVTTQLDQCTNIMASLSSTTWSEGKGNNKYNAWVSVREITTNALRYNKNTHWL